MPAGDGLPPFSWLHKFPKKFLENPSLYTRVCSWCAAEFIILNGMWRVCSRCDTTIAEDQPEEE